MIINVIDLVIVSILLWWVITDISMADKIKSRYVWTVIITIIVILAEMVCSITDNTVPDNRIWSQIFNVIGFSLTPFILLIESNRDENRVRRLWIYLPAVINAIFTVLSPLTGYIFYVSEDSTYSRGKLFPIFLIAFLFSVAISMYNKVYSVRNMPNHFVQRIIITNVIMLGGVTIQVFIPDVYVTWLTISIYLLLNYTISCETASMIDALTKLINRMGFNKMMSNIKPSRRGITALFMMDVNDLKEINDEKGHLVGDYYLKEIADVLRKTFGTKAKLFRFGGDEFCVLLYTESEERISDYMNILDAKIKKRQKKDPVFPGLAAGYFVLDGRDIREVIDKADEMMYENKRASKS